VLLVWCLFYVWVINASQSNVTLLEVTAAARQQIAASLLVMHWCAWRRNEFQRVWDDIWGSPRFRFTVSLCWIWKLSGDNYVAHSPLREPRVPSDLETCPSPLYLCIMGFEDIKSSAIEAWRSIDKTITQGCMQLKSPAGIPGHLLVNDSSLILLDRLARSTSS
jgi:hypothetical protein